MFKPRTGSLVVAGLLFAAGPAHGQCVATQAKPAGSHYKPISRQEVNVGKGFKVGGFVRQVDDCKPIADARVGHWQPDAKGKYTNDLRAYVLTDRSGRYEFNTELPGQGSRKIHFIVTAPGYKTLITEWRSDDLKRNQVEINLIMVPAGK